MSFPSALTGNHFLLFKQIISISGWDERGPIFFFSDFVNKNFQDEHDEVGSSLTINITEQISEQLTTIPSFVFHRISLLLQLLLSVP